MSSFFMMFIMIYTIVFGGIMLTTYLLYSFGLMGMFKNCGFRKPWFAFVPFCREFALGCLAEQYDDNKPQKKYAKLLLCLSIASSAIKIIMLIIFFVLVFPKMMDLLNANAGNIDPYNSEQYYSDYYMKLLQIFSIDSAVYSLVSLISSVLSVAYTVVFLIVLYRVFMIFAPEHAVLCTVLSVFINLAMVISVFIFRKRQPQNLRGQRPPQDYTYYTPQPPQY